MTTTQTALMPVDPAVSPAQAARILSIRADLLPEEIRAGRSARRTRSLLIAAVVAVVLGLGGWYLVAVNQLDAANDNLALATDQVARAQNEKKKNSGVTKTINDVKAVKQDLKTLMATDLPWATNLDALRTDATTAGVTISALSGSLADDTGAAPAPTGGADKTRIVATLSITGKAPDKKHAATFLDLLATHKGVTDPYLTTATEAEGKPEVTYAVTAKFTAEALCGRFTTDCATLGGK